MNGWVRRQRGLSHVQRNVLFELNDRANGEDYCWPSIDRLARDVEASRQSVITAVDELAARGLIAKVTDRREKAAVLRRAGARENTKSTVYRVLYNQQAATKRPRTTPRNGKAPQQWDGEVSPSVQPRDGQTIGPVQPLDGPTIGPDQSNHWTVTGPTIGPEDSTELPNEPTSSLRSLHARAREEVSGEGNPRQVVQVVETWNLMAKDTGLAPATLTKHLASRLNQRLAEHGVAGVVEAINRVGRSAFCHGQGRVTFLADFGWLLKPESMTAALAGRYDDRAGGGKMAGHRLLDATFDAMRDARMAREQQARAAA
jgi:hypothetical protein